MRKIKPSKFVMGFVKITGFIPAMLFFKPKVFFENKIAQSKNLPNPSILMSNHTSLLDFPLYLMVFPFKNIRFLMAEVLFNKGRLFSWFLYKIGGIFVDRDAYNIDFVGDSLDTLDKGGIVGIFPEGRLPVKSKPFPFAQGIIFIALKTDAPIIPVYTDGNYGLFKRANVVIGETINIRDYCKTENPSQEELKSLASLLQQKTYALKDLIKRG